MTYEEVKKLPKITVSPEVLELKLREYGFNELQIRDVFVALGWAKYLKKRR